MSAAVEGVSTPPVSQPPGESAVTDRPKITAAKLFSLRVFTPPRPPQHPPNLDYVSATRFLRYVGPEEKMKLNLYRGYQTTMTSKSMFRQPAQVTTPPKPSFPAMPQCHVPKQPLTSRRYYSIHPGWTPKLVHHHVPGALPFCDACPTR